jgi:hypothetical protein
MKLRLLLNWGCVLCVVACDGDAGGEGEAPCVGLQLRCGDDCVDVTESDAHCGVCGNACAADERCAGSRCNAACASPTIVDESTAVGRFPELVSCATVFRFDVDADGDLEFVCSAEDTAHVFTTEPDFSVEAVSAPVSRGGFGWADLLPADGLERVSGCDIYGPTTNGPVFSLEPPCDLAGDGVSDIDDDGDFDLVLADGRVFTQSEGGLGLSFAFPTTPPGPIAYFPIEDDGGSSTYVSWDGENLVRLVDGEWTDAGALHAFSFAPVLALFPVGRSPNRELLVWLGWQIAPNLVRCVFESNAGFACRMAPLSSTGFFVPPSDGLVFSEGLRSAATVIEPGGARTAIAVTANGLRGLVLAFDREHAWMFDRETAIVRRQPMRSQQETPLLVRAQRDGRVVDVEVGGGGIVIDGRPHALTEPGLPVAAAAHPQLPIVWLHLSSLFPLRAREAVAAVDLRDGALFAVVDIEPSVTPNGAARMQFVDIDGDEALELVVGSAPTLVLDAASGAIESEHPELVRYVEREGVLDVGALEGPFGAIDLNGDGVLDNVVAGEVTGPGFELEFRALNVFSGPRRHVVSLITDDLMGTLSLACE